MARPVAVVRQQFSQLTPVAASTPTQGVCLIGRATIETSFDFVSERASIKKAYADVSGATAFVPPLGRGDMVITSAHFMVEGALVTITTTGEDMTAGLVTLTSGHGVLAGDEIWHGGAKVGVVYSVTATSAQAKDGTLSLTNTITFKRRLTTPTRLDEADGDLIDTDTAKMKWPGSPHINEQAVTGADYVYCEYVATRTDLAAEVMEITAADYTLRTKLGPSTLNNPLAKAAELAFGVAGNVKIYAIGVEGATATDFTAATELLFNYKDIYAVVPVCETHEIAASVASSLKATLAASADADAALSSGVAQRFRVAVVGGFEIADEVTLVDGVTMTVSDKDSVAGTLKLTAADTAFTDDLQLGDVVKADGVGGSATVSQIINDNLILVEGTSAFITGLDNADTPSVTITRTKTNAQKTAEAIALNGYDNKRVYMTWQKVKLTADGAAVGSQYLAAIVGGAIAGSLPHASLTGTAAAGVHSLVDRRYTEAQLSQISNAGLLVFKQDQLSSPPYCIHSVSTDTSALELSELSLVKVFDYVASLYQARLEAFTKGWNINAQTLGFVRADLEAATASLLATNYAKLGTIINSAEIVELIQDPDYGDRISAEIQVEFPKPLNTLVLRLVSQ